jgi:hypothetical protein
MKLGNYELGSWEYREYSDHKYREGYAWYRFAIITPKHFEAAVAIYNWYSFNYWVNEFNDRPHIKAHDSLVWEPSFHYRFKFLQPIYHKAYGIEGEAMPLLHMTENEAKVIVDERLERMAKLIAFS